MFKKLSIALLLFVLTTNTSCANGINQQKDISVSKEKSLNLKGKVVFPNGFKTKAESVSTLSTVSIIYPANDPTNPNKTIATGITDNNGYFSINPSPTFIPQNNQIFVVEAIRRFEQGSTNNSKDTTLQSLRSFIRWNGSNWDSITSNDLVIDTITTGISILSGYTNTNPNDTINKVNNGSPSVIGSISVDKINRLSDMVRVCLNEKRDPYASIKLIDNEYYIDRNYDVGKLLTSDDLTDLNLSYTNLAGANLSDKNLSGMDLTGINLSGADLNKTNLSNTILTNSNLSRTILTVVNISNSELKGANLSFCDLTALTLSDKFDDINLSFADLSFADVSEADFSNANLIGVKFYYAKFGIVNFSNKNLSKTNFSGADIKNINFRGANLSESNMSYQDLSGKDLTNVNFEGANLDHTDLAKIIHTNMKIKGASIKSSYLKGLDLSNKDLTNVDLYNSVLTNVLFTGTNLTNVNFTKAKWIDGTKICSEGSVGQCN